jgi:O-antigen ligase
MTTHENMGAVARDRGATIAGLRFAVFTTRNAVFLVAVLAMNYTLMRPSPVDLLFVLALLISLFHLTLIPAMQISRRAVMMIFLVLAWNLAAFLASMQWFGEDHVIFEIISKTFAVSIGVTCAVVSMTWTQRHIETFMRYYIASTVICSVLGIVGFLLQNETLTWDGRAKGFIDDPNMYGSFLIPAVVFCAYFLSRRQGNRLVLVGSLAIVLLGILLSLSRIAIVAAIFCVAVYLVFHNRHNLRQLAMIMGGVTLVGIILFVLATLVSPEFAEMFSSRLTLAQPYDVGEQGRYGRYLQVLPMIASNPVGVGVLQLEKIFPEPIHNIWLSSFVNYGWGGGIAWIMLVVGSIVISVRNYRRTRNELSIALLLALAAVVMCATLHEGEHWRQMWMMFGLIWGIDVTRFKPETATRRPAPAAVQPAPSR